MRFLAWVQAIPEKQEKSRLEQYIDKDAVINWPDVDAYYLVRLLMEIGPCLNSGMGIYPLTWQEIDAWQKQTGVELNAWEAKTIKTASAIYAHQSTISVKPDCEAPNIAIEQDPHKVAKHIKNILRG